MKAGRTVSASVCSLMAVVGGLCTVNHVASVQPLGRITFEMPLMSFEYDRPVPLRRTDKLLDLDCVPSSGSLSTVTREKLAVTEKGTNMQLIYVCVASRDISEGVS